MQYDFWFWVEWIECRWALLRPRSDSMGSKTTKCTAIRFKQQRSVDGKISTKAFGTENTMEWNNYDESAISLNLKVFGSDLIFSSSRDGIHANFYHPPLMSCIFIDAVDTWRRVVKWRQTTRARYGVSQAGRAENEQKVTTNNQQLEIELKRSIIPIINIFTILNEN